MTLFRTQRVIENMRFNLSLTNAGLDKLDEKQALDRASDIIQEEINKHKGCEYCNEEISCITIKYNSEHCDYGTNAPKFCFNCGRKLERTIVKFDRIDNQM